MKMKIKQTLRSMWALILAVLMLLSTFSAVAVTLNVESTGAITGNIYFDNTKTQYSTVYAFLGKDSYIRSYKMSLDSDNIWKTETSFNNEWSDATAIYFASTDGGVSSGASDKNINTAKSNLGLSKYTNNSSTVRAGTSNCYVPNTSDNNTDLTIMSVDEAKASHSGSSGDTTKTQYYFRGDDNRWNATQLKMSDDKTYAYYENKISNSFKITPSKDNYNGEINAGSSYVVKDALTNEAADINLNGDTSNITPASAGYIVVLYSDNPYYNYTGTDSEKIQVICVSSLDRLNSSSPTTYTVNYGVNNSSMGSLSCTAGGNNVTNGGSVGENTTVTFKASANSGYEVEGWYSNSDCTTAISGASGTTYSPKINANTNVYVKFQKTSTSTSTWYLTGWIDKQSVTDKSIPFKQSATNSNVYELTYTFSKDESGSQYVVIYDGKNAYHPATNNSSSGTAASSEKTNTNANGDPKWQVRASAGTKIDFTWNSSTMVLSWQEHQSATTYDVTLDQPATGGKISSTSTLTGLTGSTPITLKATADTGYTFTSWSATSGSENVKFSSQEAETTATVTGACTITATFKQNSTSDAVANSVSLTASPAEVIQNNPVTLTAALDAPNESAKDVKYTFKQTSGPEVSLSPNGTDSATTTFTPTEAGEYKFTVTASCDGFTQKTSNEVTVTVKTVADAKKNAFTSGIWIDAQPDSFNTDALIKAYTGKSDYVKFYLPNCVDLSKLHIYHKYGYLEIAGTQIESGSTVVASSWTNGNVNIKYGDSSSTNTSATIQVFKSKAKTLFTSTSANMPTEAHSDWDKNAAMNYKKACTFNGTYRAIDANGDAIANNSIKLKGRGNSSWEMSARIFGKYAYNITLGRAVDLVSASGKSTASKKWSMLANNVDEAMMRNMLVYNLSDAIGLPDSPMSDVYNVYNNGTYLGSYQMTEKVEVAKSGALVQGENVDKLNEKANAEYDFDHPTRNSSNGTSDLNNSSTPGYYKYCEEFETPTTPIDYKSGNYLLEFELNERFPDEISGFISNKGQQVVLKSPEIASKEEVEYVMDKFNFAEAVIYALAEKKGNGTYKLAAGSLTISDTGYSYTGKSGVELTASNLGELIDVENFAKAYLIQEFTENLDGVATSFYVDITGENAPLVSKPVWDFDWTMGQYGNGKDIGSATLDPSNPKQWFIKNKYIYKNKSTKNIIATLCSIESFWNKVKEVWNGTSSTSLLSTGSSSLFPVSALMGKKASLNPIGAATGNSVYTEIQSLYGPSGKIQTTYKNALESSVAMNEDRYSFISDSSYSQWGSKDTGSSWSAAVDYLDKWANDRATWMNAQLNDLPTEKKYLYFKDEQSPPWSTDSVYAHIYAGSNKFVDWPGKKMELIDSENKIYRVEYTGDYKNVIFSEKGNKQTGSDATEITTFGAYNMLVYSGKGEGQWHWETYQEAGTYKVNKANTTNGSFTVSPSTAKENATITITATPNSNYEVGTVTVTKSSGGTVAVSGSGNTRTFTMPAEDVTVSVTFIEGTASDYVVYLDNEAKWSNPTAYAWNGGEGTTDKNGDWPGVAMTQISGNIYKLTFTKEYANIIFSDNGANKTEDQTLQNGKIYNNSTNTWSEYNPDKGITVTAGTCTGGSVTIDGAAFKDNLKIGDQITLTATADANYAFTGWNTFAGLSITDPNSAQTSASITSVDADIAVTANFSSSKSDYYIKGTFNEWKDTNPLYTTSGDVCTTTITLEAGTYEFKVWKETGNVMYGNNGTIVDTTTATSSVGWKMEESQGNCKLQASGGTYTFTFNTSTGYLVITQGAAGNTATVISQDTEGNDLIGDSLAYISSYTKVGESTPSANTTSSVNDIEDGTSVIFTAPTNPYYTFDHWLVNGEVTPATEADGVSLKIDDVTYDFDVYAVYDYIKSNVAIATGIEHGKVKTDKTSGVKAGESVTITLTPDSGYSTNTVKVTDADDSNIPVNKLSANKYTFDMPNKDVTVSATFVQVDSFTVTFASIDTSMGTVSSDKCVSGNKYAQGTELTVKATPTSGYMFAGWYSDAQLSTPATSDDTYKNAEYTFTVSGDTTLYAKFVIAKGVIDSNLHAIFKSGNNNPSSWSSSDNYDVYKVVSGSTYAEAGYTHMFDIDKADISANTEFYFALSSSTSYSNMYWSDNKDGTAKVGKDDPNSFLDDCKIQHFGYNGTNYYFPRIKVSSQNLLSLTGITVYVKTDGIAAGQYLVVPKGKTKPDNTVTIYAKNGTLKTTYAYGTTTVTGISEECEDFTSLGTPYSTYYGLKDDRIVAHTEVNATQAGYGWYVYAYVINGVSYPATKVDGTTSTYQMDTPYIVQEGQDVEITPIYLNTNIEKEDGYVTLYVDPNDLGDHWGNTISVYSYYYVGETTEGAKQMNSAYPGEPMMLESTGLYKAFIPKDAWEVNAESNKFVKVENCSVSGLTLNNYMEGETVHQNFLSAEQKKNYQTYDYDDFKVIAKAGYDTVKFDVKYRTNTTNQSSLLDNANDHPVKTGSKINPADYYYDVTVTGEDGNPTVTKVPEWEDLTDIDGNLASIVGFTSNSVPSTETFETSEEKKLYIVSTGNQNTSMGEWSTVWYVYDHNGDYITQGLPSDFIPRYTVGADGTQEIEPLAKQKPAYQAIFNANKNYEYTSALIAYESEQDAKTSSKTGNSGIRLDGRWYYARSTAELTVKTHVLYADSESVKDWTEDTYNSDLTGKYTGALATVEDVRDKTVSRNTSVTVAASPSAKGTSERTYKFIGWATDVTKNEGGTYTPTKSTTLVDSTSIFSVVSDTDVYALYVPVGEGDLVINHSAYSTVNSGANGGTGRYFVQAVVTHSDKTTHKYYAQNGVTVPITSDDETVEVTLYTVSTNGCSYVGTYVYNGTITEGSKYQDITTKDNGGAYVGKVNPASAPATVTHSFDVSNIFDGDNSKKRTSKLDYYSDLKTNTITVKLNYYDRKVVNGSPANISDKETTYTYKPATYPSSVYEKNSEGELVLSLSNLITYTVNSAVKPDNVLDTYYYWPSQSAAVKGMQSLKNYHKNRNYLATEVTYHTDQYGNPQTSGENLEKWVTYYGKNGEIEEDVAKANVNDVTTISIWYFNTPKKYSYTMNLAKTAADLSSNSDGTYYSNGSNVENVVKSGFGGNEPLFFNQRLGGEGGKDEENTASAYLQAYGITTGYVATKTETARTIEVTQKDENGNDILDEENNPVKKTLKFVGWATDKAGKNIVTTNYKYGLRITGNVEVYAIYGENELDHPGVNVQGIKPDQYFNQNNVSMTRISTMFTAYNCPDNDKNIENVGIVYLRVANSVTQKALDNISDDNLKILRNKIAEVVSKAKYSSFKSGIGTVEGDASSVIVNLSGSPASGFKFKVVHDATDTGTGLKATLNNKNRGQFTNTFSTSVIKGFTYYTFATMGYKNYPSTSSDKSVYVDEVNKITYITSDNFATFKFKENGVCETEF